MTPQYRPSSLPPEAATQTPMPPRALSTDFDSDPRRPGQPGPEPAPEPVLQLTRPAPDGDDDYLHHIIIGSPKAVEDTIKLLHVLRYVEGRRWTPLIAIREQGLRITPNEGQVLSYLVRRQPNG